jgi:hypothetical protein
MKSFSIKVGVILVVIGTAVFHYAEAGGEGKDGYILMEGIILNWISGGMESYS